MSGSNLEQYSREEDSGLRKCGVQAYKKDKGKGKALVLSEVTEQHLVYNIEKYSVDGLTLGTQAVSADDDLRTRGTVRWIGRRKKDSKPSTTKIVVGLELKEPNDSCNDGFYDGIQVIHTDQLNIIFLKLKNCKACSIKLWNRQNSAKIAGQKVVTEQPQSQAQRETKEIEDLYASGIPVVKLIDIETELYTLNISSEYLTYNIDDYMMYKLRYGDVVNAGHDIIGELVWMGRRMSVKPSLDEVIVGIKMGVPDKKCKKGTIGKAKVVETDRKDIYFTELRDLRHASIQRDQRSSGTLTVDMSKPSASSKPHSIQKTKEPRFMYDDPKELSYLLENGVTVEALVRGRKFIDQQDVSYITFNIRDFSINGLKHGVEAFAEEEEEAGKVVWIGHNQHNDTIYVGIEMEFPNQRCTKGNIGTDTVYPTEKKNIFFTELSRCGVYKAPPPRRCGSRKGERKPDKSLDQDEYATDWEVELSRLRDCRVEVENKTDKEAKFCSFFNSYGGDGYITYITYNIYNFRINELTVGTVAQSTGKVIGKVVWIGRITASTTVYVGVEMNPPIEGCTAGVLGGVTVYPAVKPNIYFEELHLLTPYTNSSRADGNQQDHVKSRLISAEKKIPDVTHAYPESCHWNKEKISLKEQSIEVNPRKKDTDTPFYEYSIKNNFIAYNIHEYIIYGLYHGMPARTKGGLSGKIVWMGRHFDEPTSIYVGAEMTNPIAQCTAGIVPEYRVKVYEASSSNIYFEKLFNWEPYTSSTTHDLRVQDRDNSSEPRRYPRHTHSDLPTPAGSNADAGRSLRGIPRHIKLGDITDVDDSPYYHREGQFDVYHIDKFVIEGIASGDKKKIGNRYPGTIVCMVNRRSDDLDKSSILVGLKMDAPDESVWKRTQPEGLSLANIDLRGIYFCPLSRFSDSEAALKAHKYQSDRKSPGAVRDDLIGQTVPEQKPMKINVGDGDDNSINNLSNYSGHGPKTTKSIYGNANEIVSQNIDPDYKIPHRKVEDGEQYDDYNESRRYPNQTDCNNHAANRPTAAPRKTQSMMNDSHNVGCEDPNRIESINRPSAPPVTRQAIHQQPMDDRGHFRTSSFETRQAAKEKRKRKPYHSSVCQTGRCDRCYEDDLLFWVAPQQCKDGSWVTEVVPPKLFRRADYPLTKRDAVEVEDEVPDYVPPPSDCSQYHGVWKGVQGDQNSCYMDASMFAMFSYLSLFDDLMLPEKSSHKDQSRQAMQLRRDIKKVMKDKIVNRLRKYGLTQHDGMHQLRGYLDSMGLVQGLTGEEKDPEEFLNLLLVDTFQTPPPIVLSNGQESHLFHILADKEEKMVFPTVQELLERTCLQERFRFAKIPPYLIMHLPRFGKGYKMYPKVFPSLELDMTGVMEGARQKCIVCDDEASYECYDCYKAADDNQMEAAMFCEDDVFTYHSKKQRDSHKHRRIKPTASPSAGAASMMPEAKALMPEDKQKLRLAAVLCIETSHYVTYVSTGSSRNAPWQFFDSMADREETTNIPEVKDITDIRKKLMECREDITTADPIVRRLVKDAYICIYVNPDADRRPDGVKIHEEAGIRYQGTPV